MRHFIVWFTFLLLVHAEEFKVYTEQNPPFNFMTNTGVHGTSTQLLKRLFEKAHYQLADNTIALVPWARGYHEVLHVKNTMIYSMARTPEREALFAWVGPIGTMRIGILAKKNRHVVLSNLKENTRYKIGTILNTAAEQLMLEQGMNKRALEYFTNIDSQLKKLKEDRLDGVAFSIDAMYQLLRDMGCDLAEYEVVYVLRESDLYFAFNKQTNPQIIQNLNDILPTLAK